MDYFELLITCPHLPCPRIIRVCYTDTQLLCVCSETRSQCVAQVGFELKTLRSQLPENYEMCTTIPSIICVFQMCLEINGWDFSASGNHCTNAEIKNP